MKLTCRNRIKKGSCIIKYILTDTDGKEYRMGSNELKEGIHNGIIEVDNLRMTHDGRLIKTAYKIQPNDEGFKKMASRIAKKYGTTIKKSTIHMGYDKAYAETNPVGKCNIVLEITMEDKKMNIALHGVLGVKFHIGYYNRADQIEKDIKLFEDGPDNTEQFRRIVSLVAKGSYNYNYEEILGRVITYVESEYSKKYKNICYEEVQGKIDEAFKHEIEVIKDNLGLKKVSGRLLNTCLWYYAFTGEHIKNIKEAWDLSNNCKYISMHKYKKEQ